MLETGTYTLTKSDGETVLKLLPDPDIWKMPEAPVRLIHELETNIDARWPFPRWGRASEEIRYITIHHSAGQRATQNIRWWHRYHTQNKSWSRAGYHFGIAAYEGGGAIDLYQINELSTVSWHDTRNHDTIGICISGWLSAGRDVQPNDLQLELFGRLMAWLLPRLPNLESIVGHKHWQRTACPGDIHLWGYMLVDAAKRWGCDIGELLGHEAAHAATERILGMREAVSRRKEPPRRDYLEHLSIGDEGGNDGLS
ncbi:MAG: peptidoglycan recognition protein family protein [Planctomycetota bacterium]|jgi:hypothetical protein